jgi:hypothetical protein
MELTKAKMNTKMKKIFILLMTCFMGIMACNEKTENPFETQIAPTVVSRPMVGFESSPIRIVLRHQPTGGEECGGGFIICPSCSCNGGICSCAPAVYGNGGGDYGTFTIIFHSNDMATIKFSQITAINEPTIMPGDFVPIAGGDYLEFDSQICQDYGVNSIKIPAGNYVVDYSNSNFGEITVPYQWD